MLFTAATLLLGAQCAAALDTKRVLVLFSNNRLVPGNIAIDHGLSAMLTSDGIQSVRIYTEFLDRPEFSGDAHENLMVSYLHGKYAAAPPDAIVAVADGALSFVVRHRAQLFPEVPIIHAAVSTAVLKSIDPMPVDVVGVPNDYDYSGTIVQALRLHPAARRLVLITGAASRDLAREERMRREVPAIAGDVAAEYWSGLSIAVLQHRLSTLGSDAVVFTAGFFQDGDGNQFSPRDAAALIARASTAPVYGPFDTFIGTGVVGGRMPSFEDMGKQAGQIVKQILAGTAPAALRLPNSTPTALHIDWRQAQRWRIDEKLIPADTIVHFRQPT